MTTTPLLIQQAHILTETDAIPKGWLLCRDGLIADIGTGKAPEMDAQIMDAQGQALLPGFIDVHVHGAVGADTMDGQAESLRKMAAFFAKQGVTGFLPTTLTAPHEAILAALEAIQHVMAEAPHGARILGAHLEGPYLNIAKTGAQNPQFVRPYDAAEARHYLDSGILRLVSLAPEIAPNEALISACTERGITASVAHTNASYEEATRAIMAGISHATHTYNAMTGLHHRNPGTLGAVLESDKVFCELIADTIHVHPAAMHVLWKAKGREKLILITDAMTATGMPAGNYTLGELHVQVADGKASLADGTLAGSVLTMPAALRHFLAATGASLEEAWPVTSFNAAKSIGLQDRIGSIALGKRADLVLLDAEQKVQKTIIGGKVVFATE